MTKKSYLSAFRSVACAVLVAFTSSLVFPSYSFGQSLNLPIPGTMVMPTPGYVPALIKGITIHPENPLAYDFIIDTGHSGLEGEALSEESTKLIKYFLASLTVPEDELWVNLSPYEKDRITADSFGKTEMGRDLLGQDYILKQLTSSLLYPESDLGKEFWNRVHNKVQAKFGNVEVPVNTFNKVWIIPQDAVVYEHENSAFVIKSRLKVMLEEDYVALKQDPKLKAAIEKSIASQSEDVNALGSQVVREIIIPEIEKEVNEGKNFASLRQIYNSMILAAWFKNNLKQSLLGQVYVDKNKVVGVDADDPEVKEKIYQQYLEAYTKGVYNYIREDVDPVTENVIPRKYFSGGFTTTDENGLEFSKKVAGSTVHEGTAPQAKPTGKVFRVNTAVTENQPNAVSSVTSGFRKRLLSVMIGGLALFLPSVTHAVAPQTASIYANNQASYQMTLTIPQAQKELDVNLDAMYTKFKADKKVNTAFSPWLSTIIKSTANFTEFSQQVSRTLQAETDKQKLTALQKDVLRAVYVFVNTNAFFDSYGQIMDSPGVGSYRNFIVGDSKYPGQKRTIICQTITEFNLALFTYELGFSPNQVTAIDVLVNYQGQDMAKNGGHSANLVKFANGESLIYDVIQGSPANSGIGVAHKVIVIKGQNSPEQVNLAKQSPTQALQGDRRGNTVEELAAYQEFELVFVKQLNALLKKQNDLGTLILDKKYQEAIDQYTVLRGELLKLFDEPMFKTYLLERYSKNLVGFKDVIDGNLAILKKKLAESGNAVPNVQPAAPASAQPQPAKASSASTEPQLITKLDYLNLDDSIYKIRTGKSAAVQAQESQLLDQIFVIGERKNIFAHGVDDESAGLRGIINIALEGQLRPNIDGDWFVGQLTNRNPKVTSGSHGPFYAILTSEYRDRETLGPPKSDDDFQYFLFPGDMERTYAQEIVKAAAEDGVITPARRANIISKMITYQEFIDKDKGGSFDTPVASSPADVGGINLDPALLNLQIKRDLNGVPLPMLQQPIKDMNIQGFYPVIINITPVNDLPMLLGSSK